METLLSEYKRLKNFYQKFEDFKDLTPENIDVSLKLAEKIKETIRKEALFSSNEIAEDIPTENIQLMLVPFYHASIIIKITDIDRRKTNLEFAEAYLEEFFSYLDDYRITPENFKENRKSQISPTRESKILAFKAKKELESQIKLLESENLDDYRELYLKELELAAMVSLDHLDFIKLELQMLSMRDIPRPDPEPYRPPQILKIDRSNIDMVPRVISSTQDIARIRENIKAQVFTQRNAPTMTIEEYGDWAYEEMKKREEQTKAVNNQPEYDSDDEDQREQKRKKDSSWDNWKDDHEKGAGNRNGR
jgi:immunoglobulin-binding protein 1